MSYRLGVDVGGTFTDLVLIDENDGNIVTAKIPSTPADSSVGVLTGMVAAGHTNDGGGSIRAPAAWCGLVGLKPTRGRNPLGPDYGDMGAGLIHEHVVPRTVRDTAAILDVTAGPDLGAPYYAPPPARPFIEAVGADPGKLSICFSTRPVMGTEANPDYEQAVRDAAALCTELGH